MRKDELWENALAAFEIEASKANFAAFLGKTKLASLTEKKAVISCPNPLIAERLKKRYNEMIKKTLADLTGKNYCLAFEVQRNSPPSPKPANLGPLFTQTKAHSGLFPSYTFENFVVGPSNRLAHTAALSVTNQQGTLHNPLLLYAGVGLGKTHLMHAIGNAVKAKCPEAKIRYCPAETFTNEMIEAIQDRRSVAQFRRRFRSVDLLMIDDIQFLAGREATQEEFFNTFNKLYLSEKQVVLTSDRHPQEIKRLEARLISRFSGGMVADMQPPDLDLRIAILKQKAKEREATLNDQVILALAEQAVGNIRQLEGILAQLLLLTQTHQEISPEELVTVVTQNNPLQHQVKQTSPETILARVSQQFEVTEEELAGKGRAREVVLPRQVAMYLMRKSASLSLERIGEILGGRDHSTVLYGIKNIEEKMKTNLLFQKRVESIQVTTHQSGKVRTSGGKIFPKNF